MEDSPSTERETSCQYTQKMGSIANGFLKINVDASYHEETRSGGWGVICRDNTHDIVIATACPLEMMADALHAEGTTLSHAIQVADQLGMGKVIFETDCINLKHAMTTSEYEFTPIGVLVNDMKFRLQVNFIDASVVYAPRACNKPAHELAALGVGVAHGDHVIWSTSFPSSVTCLMTDDYTVF